MAQQDSIRFPDVISKLSTLPEIQVEVCGSWIWVSGDTKQHRTLFKSLNMRWHGKKRKWYWRPPGRSRYIKRSSDTPMQKIRVTYGSQLITAQDD